MKTHKHTRFTLVLGLLLAGGAISLGAHADSEVGLLVHHNILKQPAGLEQGQMQVEIINPGAYVINDAALFLEGASNLQILPAHLQLDNLTPAQVKAVNVAFQRFGSANDETDKALIWRIDYHDAKGLPHQVRVLDGGRDQPPVTE